MDLQKIATNVLLSKDVELKDSTIKDVHKLLKNMNINESKDLIEDFVHFMLLTGNTEFSSINLYPLFSFLSDIQALTILKSVVNNEQQNKLSIDLVISRPIKYRDFTNIVGQATGILSSNIVYLQGDTDKILKELTDYKFSYYDFKFVATKYKLDKDYVKKIMYTTQLDYVKNITNSSDIFHPPKSNFLGTNYFKDNLNELNFLSTQFKYIMSTNPSPLNMDELDLPSEFLEFIERSVLPYENSNYKFLYSRFEYTKNQCKKMFDYKDNNLLTEYIMKLINVKNTELSVTVPTIINKETLNTFISENKYLGTSIRFNQIMYNDEIMEDLDLLYRLRHMISYNGKKINNSNIYNSYYNLSEKQIEVLNLMKIKA